MDELTHQQRSAKTTAVRVVRYILAGIAVLSMIAAIFWGFVSYEDLQRDYNEMGNYYDPDSGHTYHAQAGIVYAAMTGFFLFLSIIIVIFYWLLGNSHTLNTIMLKRSVIIASAIEGILLAIGMSVIYAFGTASGGMTIFWIVHFPASLVVNTAAFLLSLQVPNILSAVLVVLLQFFLFASIIYAVQSIARWLYERKRLMHKQ